MVSMVTYGDVGCGQHAGVLTDIGRRLPGGGGELSWDPEDGYASGGRRSITSSTSSINTPGYCYLNPENTSTLWPHTLVAQGLIHS
jgi:hypothetical protein